MGKWKDLGYDELTSLKQAISDFTRQMKAVHAGLHVHYLKQDGTLHRLLGYDFEHDHNHGKTAMNMETTVVDYFKTNLACYLPEKLTDGNVKDDHMAFCLLVFKILYVCGAGQIVGKLEKVCTDDTVYVTEVTHQPLIKDKLHVAAYAYGFTKSKADAGKEEMFRIESNNLLERDQ